MALPRCRRQSWARTWFWTISPNCLGRWNASSCCSSDLFAGGTGGSGLTGPGAPLIALPLRQRGGRVAQRESTPFTREGSQVQSLSRPPFQIATRFEMVSEFFWHIRFIATGVELIYFAPHSRRGAPSRHRASRLTPSHVEAMRGARS